MQIPRPHTNPAESYSKVRAYVSSLKINKHAKLTWCFWYNVKFENTEVKIGGNYLRVRFFSKTVSNILIEGIFADPYYLVL